MDLNILLPFLCSIFIHLFFIGLYFYSITKLIDFKDDILPKYIYRENKNTKLRLFIAMIVFTFLMILTFAIGLCLIMFDLQICTHIFKF